MLLAIDVGNTNMVFGLYEGEKLRGSFRISTNAERTSDELGMQISQYYHFHGIDRAQTHAAIIASVVPPVMYTLINDPQISVCTAAGCGAGCGYRH